MASKKTAEEPTMDIKDFEQEFAKADNLTLPDIDGWYDPQLSLDKNQPLCGTIVGHMVVQGDDERARDVVLVKSDLPLTVMEGESERPMPPGSVIGVGIRYGLRPVMDYVEHKGRVLVKALGKEKIKGARTVWKFETKCIGKRSRMPLAGTASAEDLPF